MRIVKGDVDITTEAEWYRHAPPRGGESQWVAGRSARETARAWLERAPAGPPAEIEALLHSHPDFRNLEVSKVEPEARIRFDQRPGEPRTADLAAVAVDAFGTVAITVEAKADESFGETIATAFADGAERMLESTRSGELPRIADLIRALLPQRGDTPPLAAVRYPLLTAVARTLAFARDVRANRAVLIIHTFRTTATAPSVLGANDLDLDTFVNRLSAGAVAGLQTGMLAGPLRVPGAPLFLEPAALYIGKAFRTIST